MGGLPLLRQGEHLPPTRQACVIPAGYLTRNLLIALSQLYKESAHNPRRRVLKYRRQRRSEREKERPHCTSASTVSQPYYFAYCDKITIIMAVDTKYFAYPKPVPAIISIFVNILIIVSIKPFQP